MLGIGRMLTRGQVTPSADVLRQLDVLAHALFDQGVCPSGSLWWRWLVTNYSRDSSL